MTKQRLKQLVKESIEEVIEESSCPMCGESVYETETKCECMKEDTESELLKYKELLQQKLNQLK
jgi:hypothetical protein